MLPTLGVLGQFMLHQLHESSEEVLFRGRGWGDQLPGQPMSLLNISLAVHMAASPLPKLLHTTIFNGMGIAVEMPVSEIIHCLLLSPGMLAREGATGLQEV